MGNALGAPAEPGACIGDLDDGDLGRIFSLAGRQHGWATGRAERACALAGLAMSLCWALYMICR